MPFRGVLPAMSMSASSMSVSSSVSVSSRSRSRSVLALLALMLAASAQAIRPPEPEGLAPDAASRLAAVPFVLPQVDAIESKTWAASDPAYRAFVAEAGVEWQARWDRRTGRLSAALGTFPAWLGAQDRVRTPEERAATLARLDALCREFMARHAGLFRLPVAASDLRLDPVRSVAIDSGRVWQVSYAVAPAGIPVEGAAVSFRLNHGRLVHVSLSKVADALADAPTSPRLDAPEAARLGREEAAGLVVGRKPGEAIAVGQPRLALLPWADDPRSFTGNPGQGIQYRLAWNTVHRLEGRMETWSAWHDALTGERLALGDDNRYACPPPARLQGRVTGGVFVGAREEVPETLRGMPFARVENGGTQTADANGIFPFVVGGPAATSLSGTYFDMNCVSCTNPEQAAASATGWGPLALGVGGSNTVGNGRSTRAERSCFYHLNVVRLIAAKHLGDSDADAGGFLTRTTPANVNYPFSCNAFWDGNSVNFFRAGSGCNNTGEIADVMQHEWGHGIDQFTGGGADGARGEGIGDVVAFLSTHDSRLGPYFFQGDAAGLRQADENASPNGVMTTTNVGSACPPDGRGGPLGYQVHCEGQIFSQAWWHLARNLRQKAIDAGGGEQAGWFVAEKLFFQSLPLSRTYVPTGDDPTYDAVIVVDDDDGDLTNGTPNAAEINEAFAHHGMAGTPQVADSPDCVAPAAPVISLSSAQQADDGLWQVHVSWTAVPGAVEYRLTRNQADGWGADEPLATVAAPGTEFFDDDVTDGVTYRYRVQAMQADGCASIADNQQAVSVAALPAIVLAGWSHDDSANPGGNFNGIAEPGETLVIRLAALNAGTGTATSVQAELSTTSPGVTIDRGSHALGGIAPGATAGSPEPHFQITLDRAQVSCGSIVPFTVSFQSAEGCNTSGFALQVGAPPEPCEAPEPRPRLRYETFAISDGLAAGGSGDASGTAEPGETIRLPVSLTNFGNATARTIRGSLALVAGPPGTLVTDADTPWLDIRASETGTSSGAPAHVEVRVPDTAPCGSTIDLSLHVTYEGPSGSYEITAPLSVFVGRIVEAFALSDDFETGDNGFTHGADCTNPGCDDWQRDAPTLAFPGDPTGAVSGTRVWGNDHGTLVAGGSNGAYRRNTHNWLDSPVIDCSVLSGTIIRYWRWLTVEDGEYDHARVRVATVANPADADWTTVWENATGADHVDTAWVLVEHDISALADGNPTIRVRFDLDTDGGYELGGWNIDDLRVMSSSVVCGNCAAIGPPASPGASLRATPRKSETSAEMEWTLAGALGPGEEWRLYRGTSADDVTTLLSPSGMTDPSFEDLAAPDALYFYQLVKANCFGAEVR